MATEVKFDKPEPVPAGLKSETVNKLTEHDQASGKDRVPSVSISSASTLGSAISSNKGEAVVASNIKVGTDRADGEHGEYNPPTSSYSYMLPGFTGPYQQFDEHGYYQTDGSHTGMQSDNGSVVYYYPYASGTVVGLDGINQQPYYSSSGYYQHPMPYGSEAMPCYSWDSTYVGDVPSGNGKYAPGSTNFAKGLNSMKTNDHAGSKFSKSTHTHLVRPLNKVSPLSSDFSAGVLKGYQPMGKFSSFSGQKQGSYPHYGIMNYRQNGRMWNGNDRNKPRDRFNKNSNFENATELTCGPRASNKTASLDSLVKKEDLGVAVCRDQYNLPDFEIQYTNVKFYVIKSYSEDDVHKSVKYDVWSSTPNGNKKLDLAFREAEEKSSETGTKCPIFLFFSVNGSGQFVGLAEMVGQVDFNKDMDFWQLDKWNGFFPVKWHIIKDIPNNQLRHIILENNDNRPVTFSRDTQEIGLKQGLEMLNIFKSYSAKTSLLDDFVFYENREKSLNAKKSNKNATLRMDLYEDGDFPGETRAGERRFEDESKIKRATDPSSLINLTKSLSLNGYTPKTNSIKKPVENSVPAVVPTP